MKIIVNDKKIKEFAYVMFAACLILGIILLLRHKQACWWFFGAGGFFLASALLYCRILKYPYIIWMKFSFVLGFISTTVLLTVLFYLVLFPISLVLKLFNKDLIDQKINKTVSSYWVDRVRENVCRESYEHLS